MAKKGYEIFLFTKFFIFLASIYDGSNDSRCIWRNFNKFRDSPIKLLAGERNSSISSRNFNQNSEAKGTEMSSSHCFNIIYSFNSYL